VAHRLLLAEGFHLRLPDRIAAFGKLDKEFKARDAQLLGVSTDSEYVHHAWRSAKDELKNLPFPMLSTSSAS
jgi:peroxiredoxin (alkyl hydroperoxide reductase subunit C)